MDLQIHEMQPCVLLPIACTGRQEHEFLLQHALQQEFLKEHAKGADELKEPCARVQLFALLVFIFFSCRQSQVVIYMQGSDIDILMY
jgi:hypothetical protein